MSDEFDIQQAADTLKNWTRAYYREAALKREKAREEAKMLARRLLESDPTLKTVWGFGSVFEESRPFRPDSDIDLAIEGGGYFRCLSACGRFGVQGRCGGYYRLP